MYRPSWLNLTSDIEEMISEKNEREDGSSSSSKPYVILVRLFEVSVVIDIHFACRSQRAESRMSASLMLLLELEYMKRLQC